MRPAASRDRLRAGWEAACRATLIARDELRSGDSLSGPAVISEYSATTSGAARMDGPRRCLRANFADAEARRRG